MFSVVNSFYKGEVRSEHQLQAHGPVFGKKIRLEAHWASIRVGLYSRKPGMVIYYTYYAFSIYVCTYHINHYVLCIFYSSVCAYGFNT